MAKLDQSDALRTFIVILSDTLLMAWLIVFLTFVSDVVPRWIDPEAGGDCEFDLGIARQIVSPIGASPTAEQAHLIERLDGARSLRLAVTAS